MELTKNQANELDSLKRTRTSIKAYLASLGDGGHPKVVKGEKVKLRQVEARLKELNPEIDLNALDLPPAENQ